MDRSPAALPPAGAQESCSRPQLTEGPPCPALPGLDPVRGLLEADTVSGRQLGDGGVEEKEEKEDLPKHSSSQ